MRSRQPTPRLTDGGIVQTSETRDDPLGGRPHESGAVESVEPPDPDDDPGLPGGAGAPALSLDDAFDIVKNRRRRRVLEYVLENGRRTTLSDLAEHIAALENEKRGALLSSQERKRVYIGLYQCHLPRMDDVDVIAFDRHRGTVDAGPHASVLAPYVDVDEPAVDGSPRLARRTLTLVLAGAALFGLTAIAPGVPSWAAQAVVVGLILAVGALGLVGDGRVDGIVGGLGLRGRPNRR